MINATELCSEIPHSHSVRCGEGASGALLHLLQDIQQTSRCSADGDWIVFVHDVIASLPVLEHTSSSDVEAYEPSPPLWSATGPEALPLEPLFSVCPLQWPSLFPSLETLKPSEGAV